MNAEELIDALAQQREAEAAGPAPICPVNMDDLHAAIRVAMFMHENTFAAKLLAIFDAVEEHQAASDIARAISNPGLYDIH